MTWCDSVRDGRSSCHARLTRAHQSESSSPRASHYSLSQTSVLSAPIFSTNIRTVIVTPQVSHIISTLATQAHPLSAFNLSDVPPHGANRGNPQLSTLARYEVSAQLFPGREIVAGPLPKTSFRVRRYLHIGGLAVAQQYLAKKYRATPSCPRAGVY